LQSIEEDRPTDEVRSGVVFKKSQGHYEVEADGQTIDCELSSTLRKQLIYPISAGCTHPPTDPIGCSRCRPGGTVHRRVQCVADIREQDPIAVGDLVRFIHADEGHGIITDVMPRKNQLVRRAAGKKPIKQVIVANAGAVMVVAAAKQPAPSWGLVDRYLAAAEEAELPACIVITKMDLVEPDAFAEEIDTYTSIGYRVIRTSAATGLGIDELRAAMRGRISVFAGKSGAGKTTLLNALQPELGLRVAEVGRQTGKGKHTTSHLQMFALSVGGAIVDTPGMREFGLWDVTTERQRHEHGGGEIATLFPDLRPYVGRCRFGLDCSHTHEPGCAITRAVAEGLVSPRRHMSYLRIVGRGDGAAEE
jgi:ribosome biogenesis GTPase